MAVSGSRELTNRRILEELELNKKLLKQVGVSALNSAPLSSLPGGSIPNLTSNSAADLQSFSSAQRSPLNIAHSQSYGYYISQDSSFGNLILPVLPRFDKK